jgi:hypothetical protein
VDVAIGLGLMHGPAVFRLRIHRKRTWSRPSFKASCETQELVTTHHFGGILLDTVTAESPTGEGWVGECQGSCRLNSVMIPSIDEAAVLAA